MVELIRLPKLGANVSEGVVGQWHVREGDAVAKGDALVEIITSKAAFDVEAPENAAMLQILVPEKSVVPVGYILALTGSPGETAPAASAENEELLAAFRQAAFGAGPAAFGRTLIRATPGARRLAKAEEVDLGDVPSASEIGVICETDVRRFLRFRLRK